MVMMVNFMLHIFYHNSNFFNLKNVPASQHFLKGSPCFPLGISPGAKEAGRDEEVPNLYSGPERKRKTLEQLSKFG